MKQKLEHLTSSELRALIAELRPLEVCDLVEREHQVLAARQMLESLSEQLRHAKTEAKAAHRQLCNWRLSHPFRTRLHYLGWMPSRLLAERESSKSASETEVLQLTERVYLAAEHVKKIECEAEARIQLEQAPVREHIAKLEYLWQKRVAQEQMERKQTQTQEPASNLSPLMVHKLRREMKTQDLHPAETGRTSADSSHNTGTVAKPREFWKVVSRVGKG
ncbi:MAG: hypothetical protein K0S36_2387 [Nitrosospira multiformis]|jgi:hypothetical protein|nr:hypothetical protein [Nitrosospira multiformis]